VDVCVCVCVFEPHRHIRHNRDSHRLDVNLYGEPQPNGGDRGSKKEKTQSLKLKKEGWLEPEEIVATEVEPQPNGVVVLISLSVLPKLYSRVFCQELLLCPSQFYLPNTGLVVKSKKVFQLILCQQILNRV